MPIIQFSPVLEACTLIANAYSAKSGVDLSRMRPSSATKALATLEVLGFVVRKTGSLEVTNKMFQFIKVPESRVQLLADAAISMEAFSAFIEILKSHTSKRPLLDLGRELNARLGAGWRDGTAETNAKILMDWARHTGLAPKPFIVAMRGRFGRTKSQPTLAFDS